MSFKNCQAVAINSRNRAEEYVKLNNFGRAFSHYLVALKLNPAWKNVLKEPLSMVLCEWGTILDKEKRCNDLFKCYEQALEIFPDNEYILNNLGAHLLRFGLIKEAAHYFRKCLSVRSDFLRAHRNLENVANLAVQRWHFRMLNDLKRNIAFRKAIQKKVKLGYNTILDIGTGTGIFSLFAVEAGAKKIIACDSSPFMIDIAHQVIKENNCNTIKLVCKHSSNLKIPEDIPERIKLIVTETVDCCLFGERILETLADASNRLLHHGGTFPGSGAIIPAGANLFVIGVECDLIAKKHYFMNNKICGFNIPDISVVNTENYDCECLPLIRNGYKYLTSAGKTTYIDFKNFECIQKILDGKNNEIIKLKCSEAGRLDCFVVWFDLYVDEDIVLNTGPDSDSNDSWDQAIFPLKACIYIKRGDEIFVEMSYADGRLSFRLLNSATENNTLTKEKPTLFHPSEKVLEIANSAYYSDCFAEVFKIIGSQFEEPILMLDTFSFPMLGLSYLLQKRDARNLLVSVVRSEADRDFMTFIVKMNELENQVRFITEDEYKDISGLGKFDLILLDIIERNGELNENIVLKLDYFRSLLKPHGLLLPERVTIIGQLIESDWLERMSKVLNNDVTCGQKIAKFINIYKINRHIDFDLASISKVQRSDSFELCDVTCGQFSGQINVPIIHSGSINALAYWYKINFIGDSLHISTLHDSVTKQSALLFSRKLVTKMANLEIIYDDGLFTVKQV